MLVAVLKTLSTEREKITVFFPSLVRRIGGEKTKELKAIATEHKCELKRIRRSRNWQISGFFEQLSDYNQQLKVAGIVTDTPFIVEKISEALKPYEQASLPERLAALISKNENITLAELMDKTGCTIAQARLARDENEL
ncbi:ribosome recycling factor family protein [Vibrio diazotrophicus]|uniref:ribosome recycling factor family protein n=1 Tax=Vibrio diazotrophicus TaxID=685 RepID=UPI000AE4E405